MIISLSFIYFYIHAICIYIHIHIICVYNDTAYACNWTRNPALVKTCRYYTIVFDTSVPANHPSIRGAYHV